MRRSVCDQLPLVPAPFDHEHVRELHAARKILDAHPEFARWVRADLLARGIDADRGRVSPGRFSELSRVLSYRVHRQGKAGAR
jgi:hypothetical protein